jgi:transposase
MKAAASHRERDRLRAIKALILRPDFEFARELFNLSERTLRAWIHVFNRQGIDGLLHKKSPGRPPAISAEQEERLADLIIRPDQAGIEHWTAKKFHGHLRDELKIECGYSTVVRWLHEHDFKLKVPQPWPDRQDEKARQHYLKWLGEQLADPDVDLWFMDEMGVEGDPRPRRRWAKRGEKNAGDAQRRPRAHERDRDDLPAHGTGVPFGVHTQRPGDFSGVSGRGQPACGDATAAQRADLRQRRLAQKPDARVGQIRAGVSAPLFTRLQPYRTAVVAHQG